MQIFSLRTKHPQGGGGVENTSRVDRRQKEEEKNKTKNVWTIWEKKGFFGDPLWEKTKRRCGNCDGQSKLDRKTETDVQRGAAWRRLDGENLSTKKQSHKSPHSRDGWKQSSSQHLQVWGEDLNKPLRRFESKCSRAAVSGCHVWLFFFFFAKIWMLQEPPCHCRLIIAQTRCCQADCWLTRPGVQHWWRTREQQSCERRFFFFLENCHILLLNKDRTQQKYLHLNLFFFQSPFPPPGPAQPMQRDPIRRNAKQMLFCFVIELQEPCYVDHTVSSENRLLQFEQSRSSWRGVGTLEEHER